jgi:2-polyprenyl-3-methyl-5-hydroxy-6-metoxy-1,4-benzoquinol methylase
MNDSYDGVMDGDYAIRRENTKYIKYRYKVHAGVTANAIKRYSQNDQPRVLDFGAADGRTLLELRSLIGCGNFTGIEYSKELLHHADHLSTHIHILFGDVNKLPKSIKNQRFDVVIALAILEHLPDPIVAVREAFNVLNSGGLFIATSPNPTWDQISEFLKGGLGDHHVSPMTKSKMVQIVEEAGFELVEFQPFMCAPLGVLPYLNIWVDPGFSINADNFIRRIRVLNWLFVNSCVIGRKLRE